MGFDGLDVCSMILSVSSDELMGTPTSAAISIWSLLAHLTYCSVRATRIEMH